MQMKLFGITKVDFNVIDPMTDQIFYIWHILQKKWEYNGTVHQPFIDFKKAYNSVRREVLYNILTEFGRPRKLAGLIKMCLNRGRTNPGCQVTIAPREFMVVPCILGLCMFLLF
jgi:hypothetical protein